MSFRRKCSVFDKLSKLRKNSEDESMFDLMFWLKKKKLSRVSYRNYPVFIYPNSSKCEETIAKILFCFGGYIDEFRLNEVVNINSSYFVFRF